MRRLVTADWHIKVPRKKEEQEWYFLLIDKFIHKLNTIIKEYKIESLELLGDVFDKKPTYLDVGILMKILYSILRENKHININVIHGNHDFYRKDFYLLNIIPHMSSKIRLHFQTKEDGKILYVDNPFIRYGNKIPQQYDKILFSHLACELPQFNKPAEYDFDELRKFKFIILGDIHNAFKIDENIYYTGSPFAVHKKSIRSLDERDNSFYGVLVFDDEELTVEKVELNLPGKYKLITNSKINKEDLKKYEDYIEVEYLVTLDSFTSEILDDTPNVKIIKKSDIDLETSKSNREIVEEYLRKKFEIKDPTPYIQLLEKVYPAFFRGDT